MPGVQSFPVGKDSIVPPKLAEDFMPVKDASLFPPVPRREFLRISATAVAGIAATSLVSPSSLFASPSALPLLSIGYAPSLPELDQHVALFSASDILSSDPALLARRARVTVAGFARAAKYEHDGGGVQLEAVYPVLSRTPENYPRFNAWGFKGGAGADSVGGPISFTVPVTATDGLVFLVHRTKADVEGPGPKSTSADADLSRVQLGINSGGDAKLTRGAYILAFREGSSDSAPNWSRLALSNTNGFMNVSGIGVSYVVLTIGYATPDERDTIDHSKLKN
jgi:hypothetical protein